MGVLFVLVLIKLDIFSDISMASSKDTAPNRVPTTIRDFFFEDPHFEKNWDDFSKVKESMFKESRDLFKKFDEDFRQMRCMRDNMMLNRDEDLPGNPLDKYEKGWMFPRKWMMPALNADLQKELFSHGHDHEMIRVREEKGAGGEPGHLSLQVGRAPCSCA